MRSTSDRISSLILRGRTALVLPLIFCALTSCSKESQYQSDQLPVFPAETVLISEPVVYSWARMLSNSDDRLLYLPSYQFNTLNLGPDARHSVLASAKVVVLYAPDYSPEFNEYFDLSDTQGNIAQINTAEPSLPYPYILSDFAKEDISNLAEILKTNLPDHADRIEQSKTELMSRLDRIESQRLTVLKQFSSDLNVVVESETMARWLTNPETGDPFFNLTVLKKMQGTQTSDSVKEIEEQLKQLQPDLIITGDYESKRWLQNISAEMGTPVFHLETINEGVTNDEYYFDVMDRNIQLLTLSLLSISNK